MLIFENDNCLAWDMKPDGKYVQRHPRQGEERRALWEVFIEVISRHRRIRTRSGMVKIPHNMALNLNPLFIPLFGRFRMSGVMGNTVATKNDKDRESNHAQ